MKWCSIVGSWRNIDTRVETDVINTVRAIIERGDGIVTGGALGVDYLATDLVLTEGKPQTKLQVILPTPLDIYLAHYFKRAEEGVITHEDADKLKSQLERIAQDFPLSLTNIGRRRVSKRSYDARSLAVIKKGDEIYGFRVNGSMGTQYAMEKARRSKKTVYWASYPLKS